MRIITIMLVAFITANCCYAADITVTLDSSNGSSVFCLNDSTGAQIAAFDSDGNLNIRGGMRLDSGGAECAIPETLIVDGSLGIGLSNPQAPVHTRVSGSDVSLRVDNDNAANALGIRLAKQGTEYAALQVGVDDSFNCFVHTGAAWEKMLYFSHDNQVTCFATGEVGIGRTNPEEPLHVSGDVLISKDYSYYCEDTAGANVNLLRINSSDSIELNVETLTTANDYPLIMGGTTVDFRDRDNALILRMDESGEVGLGTDVPSFRLDVNPTVRSIAKFGADNPLYLVAPWPCVGFNTYYDSTVWRFGKGSAAEYGGYITVSPADGRMLFYTGNTGNEDQAVTNSLRMTITAGGSLGIVTGTPSETLEVNGRIRATPVCARWIATNHGVAGPVRYQWGNEVYNSDPSFMGRTDSNYDITIYKAGYYLISMNVLIDSLADNERSDVQIRRSDSSIGRSLGSGRSGQSFYKHIMNVIEYFNVNDTIDIYNSRATSTVYGAGNWSTLSVSRLN